MLIDANLLLFAVNEDSPFHVRAWEWLTDQLNGERRVAMPWQSLGAFLRIATQPRAWLAPLEPSAACEYVEDWLENELVWVPTPSGRHVELVADLMRRYQLRGNLIPDAQLAALAIEHGIDVCSADTDFARFTEVRWHNPLAD
jgi:toxin-antitoxin system PIN domain toxin